MTVDYCTYYLSDIVGTAGKLVETELRISHRTLAINAWYVYKSLFEDRLMALIVCV